MSFQSEVTTAERFVKIMGAAESEYQVRDSKYICSGGGSFEQVWVGMLQWRKKKKNAIRVAPYVQKKTVTVVH